MVNDSQTSQLPSLWFFFWGASEPAVLSNLTYTNKEGATSKTLRERGLHLHQRLPRDKQQGGLLVSVLTHQSPAGGYKYRPRVRAIISSPWRDSKVSVLPACIKRPADSNLALAPFYAFVSLLCIMLHSSRTGVITTIRGEDHQSQVNRGEWMKQRKEGGESDESQHEQERRGDQQTHLSLLVPPKNSKALGKLPPA